MLPPMTPQPSPLTTSFNQAAQTTFNSAPPQATPLQQGFSQAVENVYGSPVFAQTPNGDQSWLDNIWDWAVSDTGLSTIAGAASGAYEMYQAGRLADRQEDSGPSAAELYDKRVAAHNKSINTPMDMGMIKLKR